MIGRDVLRDLSRSLPLEWLLADGRGGYACGTVAGAATRRYHSLLTVAHGESLARTVLLARLEEEIEVKGERVPLSTNLYPGAVHPRGFDRLTSFTARPLPSWRFEIPGGEVERTLCLDRETGALVVRWRLLDVGEARLRVRPILAMRDHHGIGGREPRLGGSPGGTRFFLDGSPDLLLRTDPPTPLSGDAWWYRRYEYTVERDRGLEWSEDLPSPGAYTLALRHGDPAFLVASDRLHPGLDPRAALAREEARRQGAAPAGNGLFAALAAASDEFPFQAPGGRRSIVAGFPWFADWGRDALVALPGLLVARDLHDEAADVLRSFAASLHGGLVPNRWTEATDGPAVDLGSADAALWFAAVGAETALASGSADLGRELLPSILRVFESFEHGTSFGIRVRGGLVSQGAEGRALTWMDARVDGAPVTPRAGCAVELSALWHRALRSAAALARREGRLAAFRLDALADRTSRAFADAFALPNGAGLADVAGDPSCRPNQVLALAGPHPVIPPGDPRAAEVLARVRRALLTPRGLRTLDPADPRYRGRYAGGVASRDSAYHQGAAWPWLFGPFADAVLSVEGEAGRDEIHALCEGFVPHLEEACVGQVSEVFDGDAPHAPGGAFAQAWSVGELLRVVARLEGARGR